MKARWSFQTNKIVQVFAIATATVVVFSLPSSVRAQSASEMLFNSKCAAPMGPTDASSAVPKKMGCHNSQSAEERKIF